MNFFAKSTLPVFLFIVLLAAGSFKPETKPRVLVFSRTTAFHHTSIPAGNAALLKLGKENGFDVDTTTNNTVFREALLKQYAAVVFLNTTGNVLNSEEEVAFERYIQAGGGFVGIHAASDTEYDWGWYGRLVGAYFESHPKTQDATLRVVNAGHPSTTTLPAEWRRNDEWYNFKKLSKTVTPLIMIDEKSYEGGKLGDNHPMAWYHDYDGGRAFYTALGHTEESYAEPMFLKHLLGGIRYAIGDGKALDYSKAKTAPIPEEDRFVKTMLTQGTLFEPTEMAVLPNLDILLVQRRGQVMLLNGKTNSMKQVGSLKVYHQTSKPNVNAEEGVLGLAIDPDFTKNNYVYIFYSPADTSVNRLSRFVFKNNKLEAASEKVILQFYSQREICCHTGGSLAFGKDNLLYLSTGDNATPFNEAKQAFVNNGYAPLNDEPGHEQYDARRSAGNSNDLRGKILRIRIRPDGSYEIPEGNLFVNTPKARPEIFVMGNRNPYRISVDPKTGFLYWGEVGPDAGNDSLATRGPRGYDEVNQARLAGFYGWPLFVGNNYPYRAYNYVTGQSGKVFDPKAPVNESRNNTGLTLLPPAQPAFIWYPYSASHDFPQVGTGGRNAMAGPVYYGADYNHPNKIPDYYTGKLFVYDWIRGWIRAVTMQPNGDFDKMESFMPSTKFNAPIDMELGPDGRLYVLEYGSGWFSKNADAGIARIDFVAGNRPPKIRDLAVEKESGLLPFTVKASVDAVDPEKGSLKYNWTIGTTRVETTEPMLVHTIKKGGVYPVSVTVTDEQNTVSKSKVINVQAGNERPEVAIQIKQNSMFYFPGKPVQYAVAVKDKGAPVNMARLTVSTENAVGFDKAEQPVGHMEAAPSTAGRSIMLTLDCKACHKEAEKSIGPSFQQVARRYSGKANAGATLAERIIKGSSGVWGENAMPAHPTLKQSDVSQIVKWVLSLDGKKTVKKESKSMPPTGKVLPPASNKPLIIRAVYTDNGGGGVKPLQATAVANLRSNVFAAEEIKDMKGFSKRDSANVNYIKVPEKTGWIKIPQVDLQAIREIEIRGVRLNNFAKDEWSIALGQPDGENIIVDARAGTGGYIFRLKEPNTTGLQDVYLIYKNSENRPYISLLREIRFLL